MTPYTVSEIAEQWLKSVNSRLQKPYTQMMDTLWQVMATGKAEWVERLEQVETTYQEMLGTTEMRAQMDSLLQVSNILGMGQQQQLRMLQNEIEESPQDPILKNMIVQKWNELHFLIHSYRTEVDGKQLSENEVLHLLTLPTDVHRRKSLWLNYMKLGEQVAPRLRDLVKLRNRNAQAQGYRNYYEMKLYHQQLSPELLSSWISDLRKSLSNAYGALKSKIDHQISHDLRIPMVSIRSWHYAHPFFQSIVFPHRNLEALNWNAARPRMEKWFAVRGMDISSILSNADLHPHEGKTQANCCIHVDRSGDVRISVNLSSYQESLRLLLHELGHALYEDHLRNDLPFLLRQPAQIFVSEGIAILLERLLQNQSFVYEVLGEERPVIGPNFPTQTIIKLFSTMTIVEFERELYENPDGPLNEIWWDTVERIQGIPRPDHREEWDRPYWAVKSHLSTLPVYYHHYLLGEMVAAQLDECLSKQFGSWHEAGAVAHMKKHLFFKGASHHWDSLLTNCFRAPLSPNVLITQLSSEVKFVW